jgi:8-oxo-dGTP diphosphatase
VTSPQFRIACYALVHNGKGEILLLQRPAEKRNFPNQWEFPGGKLDPGESIDQAVCREVREESGLSITADSLAGTVEFGVKDLRVIMLVFHATSPSDRVTISHEHQAYRWVPLAQALTMDLTQQVREFINDYQSRNAKGL